MIHRIRYKVGPGHTRCRWFVGPEDGTLAKAGDLVFAHDEFEMLKERLEHVVGIQFVDETEPAEAS